MPDIALSNINAEPRATARFRTLVIGLIGFLTLVDLFATQAILPTLAALYQVSPAQIGLAANAGTIGMAIAGLLAGVLGRDIDRRTGIWISLALLALPTTLLAFAPNLEVFAALRIAQGLCMATAFTLTLTYLAERCSKDDAASALAAYVTGVVASNLVGRLIAATVTAAYGTEVSFFLFAGLNLAGAALVFVALAYAKPMRAMTPDGAHFWDAWQMHLANPSLRSAYAIGFLILFGFIGVFSYVGFVLAKPPVALSMTAIGFVFLCFAPSMVTTPLAGRITGQLGARRTLPLSLLLALAGLALLVLPNLVAIIAGLVLVGVGTFFAQAVATGYVGRVAEGERAAASGLYLTFYYLGGLAGAAVIGQLYVQQGWIAAVIGNAVVLGVAAVIGRGLAEPE